MSKCRENPIVRIVNIIIIIIIYIYIYIYIYIRDWSIGFCDVMMSRT